MPHVYIPPAIRELTNGQEIVEAEGATVGQVIQDLERRFPGVKERLCSGDSIRAGLSVVVGGSFAALGMLQPVSADAEIHFLPAIGGG